MLFNFFIAKEKLSMPKYTSAQVVHIIIKDLPLPDEVDTDSEELYSDIEDITVAALMDQYLYNENVVDDLDGDDLVNDQQNNHYFVAASNMLTYLKPFTAQPKTML